jgi:putative transposon-encoded protein
MAKKHEQGLSSLSLLAILLVAGTVLTVAFKIGPLYLDNYFVRGAMDTLLEVNTHDMNDKQIRRKINDSFTVNGVRDVDIRALQIERERTRTLVSLNYEKRVNLFGNLDMVAVFNNVYDSSE